MNREILFRGKRKSSRKKYQTWVYGSLFLEKGYCSIQFYEKDNDNIADADVIPETVGQYTGKTDKNDKEMFENDYCLLTKPCVMAWGVIKYKNACYWFVESKTQADGTHNMIRLCDLESNGYEIQVKGNIHDNPKQLEVSE